MTTTTTRKPIIRNPELWIGHYVRHTENYEDVVLCSVKYAVCEWTGRLMRIEDEHYFAQDERDQLGDLWNPCYYYSEDAAIDMLKQAGRKLAA